jgi:hypothetical protein
MPAWWHHIFAMHGGATFLQMTISFSGQMSKKHGTSMGGKNCQMGSAIIL